MTLLKIIVIIFVAFAASRAYLRYKGKSINIINLLFWIIIWSATLVFVFDPHISDTIASFLGLQRGTDTIFFLAIILLFYLIFRLYVKLDTIDKDLTRLVTEISKKNFKDESKKEEG